jgi:hypothetical protein
MRWDVLVMIRASRILARLCLRDASCKTTSSGTLKRYSKALEYEYRVKIVVLGTLKRYSILSLTLYLEWYCGYSIL